MSEGMALRTREIDGAVAIEVAGYVDTNTANRLEGALADLAEQGKIDLLLDLSRVDYVSSAGWGVFISVVRQMREQGGDLRLVGMQPDVREVFELLEFQSILRAHADLDEALAAPRP